jgi:hypothetical protein
MGIVITMLVLGALPIVAAVLLDEAPADSHDKKDCVDRPRVLASKPLMRLILCSVEYRLGR